MRHRPVFATCEVELEPPEGLGWWSLNPIWLIVVLRLPAVQLLRSAVPGDRLEIRGMAEDGRIVVPATAGRVGVLLGS